MPYKPKKPCRFPGCPALTDDRFCSKHTKEGSRRDEGDRGTAQERGYDARWHKYRNHFLAGNPLCRPCEKKGRTTTATIVDHIIPARSKDAPEFYDESNHQPICFRCHEEKKATERMGRR